VTDADDTEKDADEAVDETAQNDDAATETETQPEPKAGIARQVARGARAQLGRSCWRRRLSRLQASRRGCTSSSTALTNKPTRRGQCRARRGQKRHGRAAVVLPG